LSLFETDEERRQPLAAGIEDRGEECPEQEDTGEVEGDLEDRSGAAGGWGVRGEGSHGIKEGGTEGRRGARMARI
jgi:hypothetical protein